MATGAKRSGWLDFARHMTVSYVGIYLLIHPKLRTLQLPHELLNKRGQHVTISVGPPVKAVIENQRWVPPTESFPEHKEVPS